MHIEENVGRGEARRNRPTRRLFLFTKPAVPGRVKTRLIGRLAAEETARLHEAFLTDVCTEALRGDFDLSLAWALEDDEPIPPGVGATRISGYRQKGPDLGARLYEVLARGAESGAHVAALGSDHPEISAATLNAAFDTLDQGADVVLGPTPDGGYFLIALTSESVRPELFQGIPWSTEAVRALTRDRCAELGLTAEQLPMGHDIDLHDDLEALARRLRDVDSGCVATRRLLTELGYLEEVS